jgi:putative Mg2+ transporter-C (MgtC) family protein
MTIPVEQAAFNLAVALGLSAAIGFERQWRNRLAGLRTNTLVALGAASFVIFEQPSPGNRARPAWPRRWSPASDFSARA